MPATTCVTATCTTSVCGTTNTQEGAACTDSGGTVCDGNGKCVQCLTDANCTGGATCDTTNDTCVSASCTDGMKDGQETDVDCGGPECDAQMRTCADGKMCAVDGDCQDKVCKGGICQAPTCTDGVQNGEETGVDCGGMMCDNAGDRCPAGDKCIVANDCQSLLCDATNHCPAPSCTDGVKNGFETGIDCGDTAQSGCQACACRARAATSTATARACTARRTSARCRRCRTGSRTGARATSTAATSASTKLCASGKKCVVNGDCASGVCLANLTCM